MAKCDKCGYERTVTGLFAPMFIDSSDRGLARRIQRRACRVPQDVGTEVLGSLLAWDARHMDAALAEIEVPLLVLQSTFIGLGRTRSPLRPGQNTPWFDLLRAKVPHARIETIPGVGHFSMLEAPDAVNRALGDFIAGL